MINKLKQACDLLKIQIPTTRDALLSYYDLSDEFRRRLDSCGTPANWGWVFCKTFACQRCRKYRARDWAAEASALFSESRAENLHWVTIMLEPIADLTRIRPQLKKARKDLRNLIARFRAQDERATQLRMYGAFETDWYPTHHVPRLSGYKLTQLAKIGFDYTASEVWFPHLHVLVDLGGASEAGFRDLLTRKWPGHRRVHFRNLDETRSRETNIANLMSYVLKCKHYYRLDPFRDETASVSRWPAHVVARFHEEIFAHGNFAFVRFHLKPVEDKSLSEIDELEAEDSSFYFTSSISQNSYSLYIN